MKISDRKCESAAMSNQQLMDHGNKMKDETDQVIERKNKDSAVPGRTKKIMFLNGTLYFFTMIIIRILITWTCLSLKGKEK